MRKFILVVVLVGVLLAVDVNCQQHKRRKRVRHERRKEAPVVPFLEEPADTETETDVFQLLEKDEAAENARADLEAKLKALEEAEGIEQNEIDNMEEPAEDPCASKRCGPGRECIQTAQGRARCVCMKACPDEEDNRRRVCSNYNETWSSDCEVYRSRCMCDEGSDECTNPINKHLHIDYYGECREMASCSEEEMGDFPRRMRDWLFNVMRELADRRELSPHFFHLEREAEKSSNESSRAAVAAVWKWCDLDGHPHDRVVSRHELFPIRAPLMAMEHCIAPFLDECDVDNDHRITLKEWGHCLELPTDELEEKCDDVRNANENYAATVGEEEV